MLYDNADDFLDRKRRPRVLFDHSITPWDVDNTLSAEIERKQKLQAKKELLRKRYRSKNNHTIQRQSSITRINELSTSVLDKKALRRYQPNEEDEGQTIQSSLLERHNKKGSVVRLPGLRMAHPSRELQAPLQIALRGRRCRSNNSYASPYESLDVLEEVRRVRNQYPLAEVVPRRFEYAKLSRKNSLLKWMRQRKQSILNNVYEQIKKC